MAIRKDVVKLSENRSFHSSFAVGRRGQRRAPGTGEPKRNIAVYTGTLHGYITTDVKKKEGGPPFTVEIFHSNIASNPNAKKEGRH